MAGLTSPPGFGGNYWNEDYWSRAMRAAGLRFAVRDAGSWIPSVNASVARSVNISPGAGWHDGAWDETLLTESVQFPANGGTSDRWDALVSRADWATDTRVFTTISGTTAPPGINSTTALIPTQINRLPGVRLDGIVAMVKVRPGVTTFSISDIVDMRVWNSGGGPMVTATNANPYLSMLDLGQGSLLLPLNTNKLLQRGSSSWSSIAPDPAAKTIPGGGGFHYDVLNQATCVYWKDSDNVVHASGIGVNDSPYTPGITRYLWTFPVGYRPDGFVFFNTPVANGSTVVVDVDVDGKVRIVRGPSVPDNQPHSFNMKFVAAA